MLLAVLLNGAAQAALEELRVPVHCDRQVVGDAAVDQQPAVGGRYTLYLLIGAP